MRSRKVANVCLLAIAAGATLALFVRVLITSGSDYSPCGAVPPTHGRIEPFVYALAAVVSYGFGGLWQVTRVRQLRLEGGAIPRGDVLIQFAVTVLLAFAAVALAYETYALNTGAVWPITYYVRCANVVEPGWALAGVAVTCGLLGRWLWSPLRKG